MAFFTRRLPSILQPIISPAVGKTVSLILLSMPTILTGEKCYC